MLTSTLRLAGMNQNQSHAHNTPGNLYSNQSSTLFLSASTSGGQWVTWIQGAPVSQTNTDHAHAIPADGSNTPHNNMQPYGVVQKMIKT